MFAAQAGPRRRIGDCDEAHSGGPVAAANNETVASRDVS